MKSINNSIYTVVDLPTKPSHPLVRWFDEHGYSWSQPTGIFLSVQSRAYF